jgi:hypothetical protein
MNVDFVGVQALACIASVGGMAIATSNCFGRSQINIFNPCCIVWPCDMPQRGAM